MLRVAGKRITSSLSWRSANSSSAFFSRYPVNASDSPSDGSTRSVYSPHPYLLEKIKGFASDSLATAHDTGKIPDIPAAVATVKNPTSKIVYERFPPGSPSKRAFATSVDISSLRDPQDESARVKTMNIFRPLSPHLPLYKPQLTSTLSIFHRITGAFLATMVLGFYLVYLKIGLICFTYESFYQFLFSSSKLILISVEISALALSYHVYHGVHKLLTDFSGNLFRGRKMFK